MENTNKDTETQREITLPCSLEPQMGRCHWGYVDKFKAYMCSICGNEFIRVLTREQVKKEAEEKAKEVAK